MSTQTRHDSRFTELGNADRIFAISAIHGDIERLTHLHDQIYPHITPGDRVLYTGNYIGYGAHSHYVLDEILAFRRAILAKPGIIPTDLVYLRGAQEEMWQKLLQLQFAPDPTKAFTWMLGNGLSNTLSAYGLCPHDGIEACNQGMIGITNWTNDIRDKFKKQPGHETFSNQLVRAAFTAQESDYPMLFVNAGIDTSKPLERQGDNFWWAHERFEQIDAAYKPFEKIIRGYDPAHKGINHNCVKATIDGGCGFGGTLVCSAFSADGDVIDMVEC